MPEIVGRGAGREFARPQGITGGETAVAAEINRIFRTRKIERRLRRVRQRGNLGCLQRGAPDRHIIKAALHESTTIKSPGPNGQGYRRAVAERASHRGALYDAIHIKRAAFR